MRLGNQFSSSTYDNFRFKDGRTSFTASPYTLPVSSIPTGPPGLAANFEWWPIKDSEFYVVGTVNDLNANGGEWVWHRPFQYGQFFYGLEETDLAWRLLNEGWTIRYSAEITMGHPRIDPARHDGYHFHTARNRVWLAHRTLPLPLAATYVTVWFVVTALRNLRSPTGLRSYAAGTRAGIRSPAGPRAPMRWRTVAAMTRLGRPPII